MQSLHHKKSALRIDVAGYKHPKWTVRAKAALVRGLKYAMNKLSPSKHLSSEAAPGVWNRSGGALRSRRTSRFRGRRRWKSAGWLRTAFAVLIGTDRGSAVWK